MASLLIKNLPQELHTLLKERAAANRRSLNSETIHLLEEAITVSKPHPTMNPKTASLSDEALAKLPPEAAERLRALRELRSSLATRDVDFAAWKKVARESRR